MKKILTLSFAAVLLLAGLAWSEGPVRRHVVAGPGHHGMFHGGGPFGAELDLTDEQKAEARKLHEETFEKAKPLFERHRQQMEAVHELLDSGNPNPTEVGQRMIAAHATHQQIKALHEEAEARFAALLNAEQLEKFREHQEKRKERGHRFFFHHRSES